MRLEVLEVNIGVLVSNPDVSSTDYDVYSVKMQTEETWTKFLWAWKNKTEFIHTTIARIRVDYY